MKNFGGVKVDNFGICNLKKKHYFLDLGKCEAGGISMNILFDSMGWVHTRY